MGFIPIYTEGLNHVYPFGLDIFHKNLKTIDDGAEEIVYSGDLSPDFTIPYARASL